MEVEPPPVEVQPPTMEDTKIESYVSMQPTIPQRMDKLTLLFPKASRVDIRQALQSHKGSEAQAAQYLMTSQEIFHVHQTPMEHTPVEDIPPVQPPPVEDVHLIQPPSLPVEIWNVIAQKCGNSLVRSLNKEFHKTVKSLTDDDIIRFIEPLYKSTSIGNYRRCLKEALQGKNEFVADFPRTTDPDFVNKLLHYRLGKGNLKDGKNGHLCAPVRKIQAREHEFRKYITQILCL